MNRLHEKLLALAEHWRERALFVARTIESDAPDENETFAEFQRQLRLTLIDAMRQHADQLERLVAEDQASTEHTHAPQGDPQPEVRRYSTSEDDDATIV